VLPVFPVVSLGVFRQAALKTRWIAKMRRVPEMADCNPETAENRRVCSKKIEQTR
jgi:hypothetical protein